MHTVGNDFADAYVLPYTVYLQLLHIFCNVMLCVGKICCGFVHYE